MQTRTIEINEQELELILAALEMRRKHHQKAIKSCEYMGEGYMSGRSLDKRDVHRKKIKAYSGLESKILEEFI